MKSIILLALCWQSFTSTAWEPDFEKAKKTAAEKHQMILLNFSGSDWCGPCIRMRKEIFDAPAFLLMADTSLVMVNADFPRNKKNQPDKKIKEQNEALADKYNAQGKFPFTLLLDANGRVIKTWDGLPDKGAASFAQEVKAISNAGK